jgi:hypothetical protein
MSAQFPSKVCHSAVVSTTMNAIVVLVALCLLVVVTQVRLLFLSLPVASNSPSEYRFQLTTDF